MRPFASSTLKMSTAPGIASFDTSQNTCRTASFSRSTSGVPGTLVNSTGRQRCWNCTSTFTAVGLFSSIARTASTWQQNCSLCVWLRNTQRGAKVNVPTPGSRVLVQCPLEGRYMLPTGGGGACN